MKSLTLFLLCLLSLVSCQQADDKYIPYTYNRFDSCTEVFGAGDSGCELCEWLTTHEYQIVKQAHKDTFTSVLLYCDGCTNNYALDYLTPSELSFLINNAK